MRNIFNIIVNDLRIFFSQRGNWISLFLLPMAFTAVLGWALGRPDSDTSQASVRIDVVDLDKTPASQHMLERLRTTNTTLRLCPMDNDSDDSCRLDGILLPLSIDQSLERVQRAQTTALIVLPQGLSTAAEAGQSVQIEYYSLEDPTVPSPVLQAVQTVVQEANSVGVAEFVGMSLVDTLAGFAQNVEGESAQQLLGSPELRERFVATYRQTLAQRIEDQPQRVRFVTTEPLPDDTSLQGFAQAVPGMGTLFVMLTVLGGMSTLLNERKQWTLQRVAIAPVSRAQILAGKAGAYYLLGMIQFIVVFLVGAVVGLNFGAAPVALLAVMSAFVLCIAGLTFALAPQMRSEAQASGLSRLLALTLAPLGGAWWPLAIVPPFMQTIGHLSPVAWAMDAFQTLIWYGGSMNDIWLEISVLVGAAAVLFGVGVATFRTGD